MHHQSEDVLPKASPIWPDILVNLAGLDEKLLDHRKEHPCPLCGGKTRFRYRAKPAGIDRPFYCNHCGSKNGIEFFMAYSGLNYSDAINRLGDYIGNVPSEKLEVKKREFEIKNQFPERYKFDAELYDSIKKEATVDLSAWQRVNGLNMLDLLKHGDHALVPLLNKNGKPCDFVMIDLDGNYQTTSGNKIIPNAFYSVFGEIKGKRPYITVSPLVAAHASIFMQRMVYCCYDTQNIWEVAKNTFNKTEDDQNEPIVIVSSIDEVKEADSVKLSQMTYDSTNRSVNRKIWKPFEIMDSRK